MNSNLCILMLGNLVVSSGSSVIADILTPHWPRFAGACRRCGTANDGVRLGLCDKRTTDCGAAWGVGPRARFTTAISLKRCANNRCVEILADFILWRKAQSCMPIRNFFPCSVQSHKMSQVEKADSASVAGLSFSENPLWRFLVAP